MRRAGLDTATERIAHVALGAAVEVRRDLGPGLRERIYHNALRDELEMAGLAVESEVVVPVSYKDKATGDVIRLDLLVERCVIIEVKVAVRRAVTAKAQLLTYMRMANCPLGFVIDFHAVPFRTGIHRVIDTPKR